MQWAPGLIKDERPAAAFDLSAARGLIDQLDSMIIDLVGRRKEISLRIQRERIRAGGVRVEAAREREIVRRYIDNLGKPGGQVIALGILGACRGMRPDQADGLGG